VGRAIGMPPGRSEIAAITESLLGLTLLVDVEARPEAADMRYIDQIIAAAAERLHASLADDTQLRSSLSEHIRRLHVRLRYGLRSANPLQNEVRKRYPDVYRAAGEILVEVGPVGGLEMPDEEIGLLTMYLAGSLERQRLRRTVRVTVGLPGRHGDGLDPGLEGSRPSSPNSRSSGSCPRRPSRRSPATIPTS